jgi:hypothetical protein
MKNRIPLLGEDQATGMPVEKWCLQFLLESLDLAADGRLAQVKPLCGTREASASATV